MSKQIRIEDKVYTELNQLKVGRQTFSDVISELLVARLKIFELISVLEGVLKFREWQRETLNRALQEQRR